MGDDDVILVALAQVGGGRRGGVVLLVVVVEQLGVEQVWARGADGGVAGAGAVAVVRHRRRILLLENRDDLQRKWRQKVKTRQPITRQLPSL